MNTQDLGTIAKEIIDANKYLVLGTADESGQPWVTPVYFSCADYRELYWMSSPEVQHSRNIVVHPQISIVVFDSHASVGVGQAVYMSATAEELTGTDFERGLDIYNGRFSNPVDHGVRLIMFGRCSGTCALSSIPSHCPRTLGTRSGELPGPSHTCDCVECIDWL